jgi:hypothetical protein
MYKQGIWLETSIVKLDEQILNIIIQTRNRNKILQLYDATSAKNLDVN